MIDLKAARQEPERYRQALARRGAEKDFDALLRADESWRSLTERAEGPESARIAGFWLDRQPSAISVFRRSGETKPYAFMAWLRLTEPNSDEIAADPVTADGLDRASDQQSASDGASGTTPITLVVVVEGAVVVVVDDVTVGAVVGVVEVLADGGRGSSSTPA